MESQKIRIRLKGYDVALVDQSVAQIINKAIIGREEVGSTLS